MAYKDGKYSVRAMLGDFVVLPYQSSLKVSCAAWLGVPFEDVDLEAPAWAILRSAYLAENAGPTACRGGSVEAWLAFR